ncbi:MAG: Uracil-DNA glycosylase, family 4 [Ktedonobacterales bacterium]|jgi:DNA polymerase|nr:MAG: Uracil-DNA glycosylase, family 4 [Ktedonobacterales bacterium]
MSAEEVLERIAAAVRDCTKCDLYRNTKNGVPGEGDPHAEVMFIGEGPGYHEDRQGRPFVGPAGAFLNELLASVGLDRSTVFITNVVKHRPPENRDPLPEEIAACGDYLTEQIAAIDPKVIVTLGRFSMARFFPGARIGAIHGQAKLIDGRIVVAMYHPAAALHQASLKQTVIDDFKRAIPAALTEATRLAAAGKLSAPKKQDDDDQSPPPPQQMTLF